MPFKDNQWRPTPKQAEFLSIPWSIREALYGGGAGSGKSELLLMLPIVHKFHQNSRFKQVILRRTSKQLKKEILPRSREFYLKFGATVNESDMVWTFPREDQYGSGAKNNGAQVWMGHCENENDVHIYDSMEINLFTPDEITSLTEYIYLYIGFTRVRTSDPSLPAVIRAAGMPGDVGHTFVKKRFVDPARGGNVVIEGKGGNKRIYIHSTLLDNPHLDSNYKQGLDALPDAERQAKLGNWDAYLGQVFEEFRDKQYPDEPSNALHVIDAESVVIPNWWPKIVVIDWGFRALTYALYGAISPDKRVYCYREQAFKGVKIEEWAGYIKEWIDLEGPKSVKLCRSAGQERGQEHTIYQQVEEALGVPVELVQSSQGSRVSGKLLLHEYLRFREKYVAQRRIAEYSDEKAAWILRNNGIAEYKAYLNSFSPPETETNLPKLQIFDTCPLLINAIKACVYDRTKIEDVAPFDGDDPYDAIRYLIDATDRYFDDSKNEFDKLQKVGEIINELQVSGDWNRYHNKIKHVEVLNTVVPIARFHSGRRN